MEIRNQKNPTCKEAGYSGDTYCADCGVKISSGKTIAKTKNHKGWKGGTQQNPHKARKKKKPIYLHDLEKYR